MPQPAPNYQAQSQPHPRLASTTRDSARERFKSTYPSDGLSRPTKSPAKSNIGLHDSTLTNGHHHFRLNTASNQPVRITTNRNDFRPSCHPESVEVSKQKQHNDTHLLELLEAPKAPRPRHSELPAYTFPHPGTYTNTYSSIGVQSRQSQNNLYWSPEQNPGNTHYSQPSISPEHLLRPTRLNPSAHQFLAHQFLAHQFLAHHATPEQQQQFFEEFMSRLSFQSLNIVPSEEYSFEDDNAGDLGVWGADPNQFFDFDQCARNSVSPKVEPAALPRNGGNNATYATGNLLNFENPDLDLSLPADMNFVNFDYNLTGFQDIIPTPPQQQQQPEAQPPQLQHIAPPQQISPPQQTRTIIPAVSSARTQKPIAPARPALFDAATIFPAQTATFAPAPTFQPTVPLAPADNLIAPVSEPFAASSASTTTRAPKRKRSISSAATADAQSNYASPESSAGGAGADSLEEASRLAAEEDKRRRNTAASARFRVKKKQKEQQLEKTAKEMTDKVLALEKRVQELNMENQFYKKLLIEKNGGELPVYRGVGEGDKL